MWRRVFVRTGFCAARVHTRRRRSGGGCRARPPAPMARDRGAIRLPCPALRAAAGGSGVGSSPSSEEAARGCARRAGPVARDLRVGPSGRHARRRDADGRVCVGRRRRSEAAGLRIEQLRRRAVGRDFWGLWDRIEKKQACGRRLTTRCALQYHHRSGGSVPSFPTAGWDDRQKTQVCQSRPDGAPIRISRTRTFCVIVS